MDDNMVVALWRFPEQEHSKWIEYECGNMSYAEYVAQLNAVRVDLDMNGTPYIVVDATVDEMLAELREMDAENNSANRAEAIARIAMREMKNGG